MKKQKFDELVKIFSEKNQKVNLSAIRDEEGILNKHIYDSISLNNVFSFKTGDNIIDLGTGGGFPGIPLAITNPEANFTLVDSTKKKVVAVNEIIEEMKLDNAHAIWKRIEDIKEKYDYVIVRAVAYLPNLLELSANLLKPQGKIAAYKIYSERELEDGLNTANKLGLNFKVGYKYTILDQERVIWVFEKN